MKPFKMLGLAALAALMAMAFIGASSAMAETTVLCTADETEACAERNIVTHVHEETERERKAKLLAGATGTVECDALYLGDVLAETYTPLVIHGNFTYTNCRLGGTNCTVTELSSSSLIEVLRLGHESADVTGEGEVRVRCGIFINCVYNGEGLLGTATGPLLSSSRTGDVTLTEQTVNKVSGICPSTGRLDIKTTPLSAVYMPHLLLYCVKYQHDTNGLFTNDTCTEIRENERPQYALVIGSLGFRENQEVCVEVDEGLWRESNERRTECRNDDERNLRGGGFERGTITRVY